MRKSIIIGSRGSALALFQARKVEKKLQAAYPDLRTDIQIIKTTGDIDQKTALSDLGGKGVFIKELEDALLQRKIDIAVHSLKDVTARLADGLALTGFLDPETTSDALVLNQSAVASGTVDSSLSCLKQGAVIGTGSTRRKMLLKKYRPDITTVDLRGNVDTRLQKMKEFGYDGILLSYAGLLRLNSSAAAFPLDPSWFHPAPGQGVICIESRLEDADITAHVETVSDKQQTFISSMEVLLLNQLHFDCRIPFGLSTTREDTQLKTTAFLSNAEGSEYWEHGFTCNITSADTPQSCLEKLEILDALIDAKQKLGWA